MNTIEKPSKFRSTEKGLLPVTLAIAEYDRTRPLLSGKVKPEGIDLKSTIGSIPEFCLVPVYEQYDLAEMSFSWYLMAHCRGEPVIALPYFPLRMPVHAYIYVRADSPITHPSQLKGKIVGTKRYRSTINVWLRGILREYYGVLPHDFSWITPAEEGGGFEIPKEVSVTLKKGEMTDIENMLFDGKIDAMITPVLPDAWDNHDPRIRMLFPDCRLEARAYSKHVGFLPMTHTVVMSKKLWEKEPWVAESMYNAFVESQQQCWDFYQADPKHSMFCETVFTFDEERRIYGDNPWKQGVEDNRKAIDIFIRYCHEQGYINRRPKIEEIFAPNTLGL